MKKTWFIFAFAVLTSTAVVAQESQQPSSDATVVELAEQKKIELSDVPNKVTSALERTAYKTADVAAVYEVAADAGKQYKFVINSPQGTRAVTFDANGTMLTDKKHEE